MVLSFFGLHILIPIPDADGGFIKGVLIYSMLLVPTMFIYGVSASIIADKIGSKARTYKKLSSFLLHLVFGIAFIIPFSVLEPVVWEEGLVNFITINGFIYSAIFFIIDSSLRKSDRKINIPLRR
jgi:hypothetical protein